MDEADDVTRLLQAAQRGEHAAGNRAMELVYAELRRLASRERRGGVRNPFQTTELVNEAYLKLVGREAPWESRGHFLCVAARAMRSVLVDDLRRRHSQKRGEGREAVPLAEAQVRFEERSIDLLALDEALDKLASFDPRKAKLVELRFFAGLSADENAQALGVSRATIERDWALARAWLLVEITKGHDDTPSG